jgi:chemosensory pili system protein ChpB (putative protein-glutamate methylesterase)
MKSDLAIGVIAASVKQLSELNRLVKGTGHAVAASVDLRSGQTDPLPEVDVWVVNLDLHDPEVQPVIDTLEALGLPVIYEDDLQLVPPPNPAAKEKPPLPAEIRQQQERRLALKLRQLVRHSEPVTRRRAQKVWVLAASTGGPDAVGQFLDGLPEDLEGIALLYVQHIEHQAMESLRKAVRRHCDWDVEITDEARVIREKTVYLISPQHQVELLEGGVLSPLPEPWGGRYKPSIDHVIAKVARVYRHRGGVIVFTGMGDDGANSCTLLHHRGGQVWVQESTSCTIDSMPVSVEKKGCVHFTGTPADLARRFVSLHRSGAASPGPQASREIP